MKLLLFISISFFVIVGCTGNDNKSESHNSDSFFSTKLKYGGTINEGTLSVPTGFAPYISQGYTSDRVNSLIYSTLFKYGTNGEIIGDLAESWSFDNSSLIINLHSNIFWHDGQKLTVDDILSTVDVAKKNNLLDNINYSISSIDQSKICIKADNGLPVDLGLLTSLYVVPAHKLDGKNINFSNLLYAPVGTGPYRFIDFKDNIISLKYVDNYYKGRALIDSYQVHIYDSNSRLADAIKQREIQFVTSANINLSDNMTSVLKDYQNILMETSSRQLIVFNVNSRLFGNISTRKQFSDQLTSVFDSLTIDSASYSGTSEIFKNVNANLECNVAVTKKIVAGKKVRLLIEKDNDYLKRVAETIEVEWGKIGVKVNIIERSLSEIVYYMSKGLKSDAVLIDWKQFSAKSFLSFFEAKRNILKLDIAKLEKTQKITDYIQCGYYVFPVSKGVKTVYFSNNIKNLNKISSDKLTAVSDWYIEKN